MTSVFVLPDGCRNLPVIVLRTVDINGPIITSGIKKVDRVIIGKGGKCIIRGAPRTFTRGVSYVLRGRRACYSFTRGTQCHFVQRLAISGVIRNCLRVCGF